MFLYEMISTLKDNQCQVVINQSKFWNEIIFFFTYILAHSLPIGVYLFIYWRRKPVFSHLKQDHLISIEAPSTHQAHKE